MVKEAIAYKDYICTWCLHAIFNKELHVNRNVWKGKRRRYHLKCYDKYKKA